MSPKISVIMPIYNTKKYLSQSIESILKQSFSDFEFIIIDDGSTDGSFEIAQKYAQKDKRIRLFKNKENKGISYTRNKLISFVTTNYIASQDSDDISLLDRLKLEYNFLEEHIEYAAVSGNNIIIDEQGKEIGRRVYGKDIKNIILKKSPLSNPSSFFRKDIFTKVGGYETEINYGEDYDLWLKMYISGYKLGIIDDFILKLRIREGQTKSLNLKLTLKNTIYLQKKYIQIGLKPTLRDRCYIFLEQCLVFFPNSFIFRLFSFFEYKKGK